MNTENLFVPKLMRLKQAPYYLGMDVNRFNEEVRPFLIEIPIGIQGIAFDRLDLDAFADDYKSRVGRPGSRIKGEESWQRSQQVSQGEQRGVASGTSTKSSKEKDFTKVLEQVTKKKRNAI